MASWNLIKSFPRAVHASLWSVSVDDSTAAAAADDDGVSDVLSMFLASFASLCRGCVLFLDGLRPITTLRLCTR